MFVTQSCGSDQLFQPSPEYQVAHEASWHRQNDFCGQVSGSVELDPGVVSTKSALNYKRELFFEILFSPRFHDTNDSVSIFEHRSLNIPIEHHPTIRYMVYNGYYKVMSNIPKMGHLPTPVEDRSCSWLKMDLLTRLSLYDLRRTRRSRPRWARSWGRW